jgi:hypothetical protein
MVAYFEVQRNAGEAKRILKVDDVTGVSHATEILERIKAVHADHVRLLSLEDYALHYTAKEVQNERNLLGGVRRYSTGDRTVTIPEGE